MYTPNTEIIAPCSENKKRFCVLEKLLPLEDINSMDVGEILERPVKNGYPVIPDVCDDCGKKCLRKNLAVRIFDRRKLEQQRCIYDHKWILSERANREVSYEEAFYDWIGKGFAESFAKAYEDFERNGQSLRHWDLYKYAEKISH